MPNQPQLNPDAVTLINACKELYESKNPGRIWEELPSDAKDFKLNKMRKQVSAYLAAALPEVTERGQLTALADKIVLEDRRGTIWQKINGTWYTPGSKHDYSDQSVMLPARVLYQPEVKP